MVKRRIFTDIEALTIIQDEECEALKVFKHDYSSSEVSSSESQSEGISDIDSVDSLVNIVPDTPQKRIRNFTQNFCTKIY